MCILDSANYFFRTLSISFHPKSLYILLLKFGKDTSFWLVSLKNCEITYFVNAIMTFEEMSAMQRRDILVFVFIYICLCKYLYLHKIVLLRYFICICISFFVYLCSP